MPRLSISAIRFLDRGPFSLEIGEGETVGICGDSGAGKTLLLRAIADLDCHGGSTSLDSVDSGSVPAPEWRRRVGLLPADPLWWHDSIRPHFSGGGEPALPHLRRLGFADDALDWTTSRLSAGERQRLALARLLDRKPEVLLLDEPTANLDPENAASVEALIGEYLSATGAGAIWVAHDPGQLRRVADRVLRLTAGGLTPLPAH